MYGARPMPLAGQFALYSGVIVVGALGGATLPLKAPNARLISFLSFAAGVMFGAAFFHMLPEAYHGGGYRAFWWLPAGFVFLFVVERFLVTHVCEEPPDCEEHVHPGGGMGLTAFFGLSIHTLVDGLALGSSINEGIGLTAFIAILAHKIPSALSLSALLKAEGHKARTIMLYALAFGLVVPAGAALYFGLEQLVHFDSFAPLALAFSAGSFLYIAVSDLLPHVNRHGKDERLKNIIALFCGLALMAMLSAVVSDHGHG